MPSPLHPFIDTDEPSTASIVGGRSILDARVIIEDWPPRL